MRYTLGIDTSSSDTLVGVVIDGRTVAANVDTAHFKNAATAKNTQFQDFSHDHLAYISKVVEQAVLDAGITYDQLDAVCVTRGPGLTNAVEVGLNFAKGLALSIGKPLIGINHLEGHIYSIRLAQPLQEINFPALVLIVSGSATDFILMGSYGKYEHVGGTLDDTAGETIEKIGRVLGFTYPAGHLIEQAANLGNPAAFNFPRSVRGEATNLSFNTLKLGVINEITVGTGSNAAKSAPDSKRQLKADISINDVAASLQAAICDILIKKTLQTAQKFDVREIVVVGGVAANQQLRQSFSKQSNLPVRFPPLHLSTNSGAMIAAAGYADLDSGRSDSFDIVSNPLWPLSEVHLLV